MFQKKSDGSGHVSEIESLVNTELLVQGFGGVNLKVPYRGEPMKAGVRYLINVMYKLKTTSVAINSFTWRESNSYTCSGTLNGNKGPDVCLLRFWRS